jgi:hypothetical protein
MLSLVVAAVVSVAPVKVAAPGLAGVGVSPDLLNFVNEHLSQELTYEGVEVFPPAAITAVVGLDRQKQLLGCGESSCAAELANALGVDAILIGNVAKLGDVFQLDARLIGASDAKVVALFSRRLQSESQLLDAMTEAAKAMAPQLATKLNRALTPIARPPSLPSRDRADAPSSTTTRYERRPTVARKVGMWTMIGGGVVAVGGFVGLLAVIDVKAPPDTPPTPTETALVWTMLGGAGAAVVGLIIYAAGGTEMVPVTASFVPVHEGGLITLGARF